MPSTRLFGIAALGFLLCALLTIWSNRRYSESGWQGDDFAEFYAAGKLAGTGHLYDVSAIHEIEQRYHGGNFSLLYLRLPFEAWLLKSIAVFPFRISRTLWYAVTSASVMLAIWLWPLPGIGRKTVLAGWFFPVANCVICGQDAVFLLLLAAIGARLLGSKREWLAGVALGCCFFKFHLGLGIAVTLLASLRWRVIAGATLAALAQIGASFLVEPGWPAQYIRALTGPGADSGVVVMPNIRGLCHWLPQYSLTAWIILALVILAGVWRAARHHDAAVSIAVALAAGVLVSPHTFVYDWVIVLPLLAQASGSEHGTIRWLALQLSFPPLFELGYLANLSLTGFALTQLIAVVSLSVLVIVKPRTSPVPT